MLYRYRRRSTPSERQQIKWVVFAAITVVMSSECGRTWLARAPPPIPGASPLTLSSTVSALLITFCLSHSSRRLGSPCCALDCGTLTSSSIARWSIAPLPPSLPAIYFGLIFALQYLFTEVINQNNDVAIVVSTLTIAAIFHPLRHRIQRIIDRRFYRSKYDAAKIIENFSATLRNEVDLNTLSEHLLAVVQETMQPAHVSLWLRKPDREVKT